MPTLRINTQALIEDCFVADWGKTTPVKFWGARSNPKPPYVEISVVFSTHGNQGEDDSITGSFNVGLFFSAKAGMAEALGLAGRVVELLSHHSYKRNTLSVEFDQARIAGSMVPYGAICQLSAHCSFTARDSG